jgi:hypothetical protein
MGYEYPGDLTDRELDALKFATGLSNVDIWSNITQYVLMGAPNENKKDEDYYRLYHCWRALAYLRDHPLEASLKKVKKDDGLNRVFVAVTAGILGWTFDQVAMASIRYQHKIRDDDALLAHAVLATLQRFYAAPEADEKKAFTPETWCWYTPLNRPAYVLNSIRSDFPFQPPIMIEILVQAEWTEFEKVAWGPGPLLKHYPKFYRADFERIVTVPEKLAHIKLDIDELAY